MPLPELPPALIVANCLARRSWDEDVTDEDRLLLEQGADTIRHMHERMMILAHNAEHYEADASHLFHLHYGQTKGGGS